MLNAKPPRVLSRRDLAHLLLGVRVLGTGGGGDPRRGEAQIEADLKRGRTYSMVSLTDVDADALIVSGGFMGHMEMKASWADVIARWETRYELEEAVRAMERYLGRSVDYLVPFELGGGNTIAVLSCAARMGIPIVDADGIGRAAPETQMSNFAAHGISLTPMTLSDETGATLIVANGDLRLPDEVGRFIVTRCGGRVANCHYPMSGKQLRDAAVPGTCSEAIKLGEQLKHTRDSSISGIEIAAETLGADIHLVGRVSSVREQIEGGFFFSEVVLEGVGEFAGHSMKLVNKNEVMAGWMDGNLISVFPDHLYLLEPDTGLGLLTRELKMGIVVGVLGRPCHGSVRQVIGARGAEDVFTCRRIGLDQPFRPTEELMRDIQTGAQAGKDPS